MAIARKPGNSTASEQQIETLINQGGGIAPTKLGRPTNRVERKTSNVLLRMPDALLSSVDDAVEARPLPTTRHTWLLEAVFEKLQRESV